MFPINCGKMPVVMNLRVGKGRSCAVDESLASELLRLRFVDFVGRLQRETSYSSSLRGAPAEFDVSVTKVKTATKTVEESTIIEESLTPLSAAAKMAGSEADIAEITVLIVPSSEFAQQFFSLSFAVLSDSSRSICLYLCRLYFGT